MYSKSITYYFIVLLFFISIFSFKINLIAIGGSGIRIDDILIFIFLSLVLVTFTQKHILISNKAVLYSFYLILFSFISVFINNQLHELPLLTGILYSVRNIEYVIFFYIGYYLAKTNFNLEKFIKVYIVYSFILIILQSFHIISVASKFNVNRAIANTGGPWELAVVISFMLFYSFRHIKNKTYFYVSFIILFLTQSRVTTFIVTLIIFYTYIKKLTYQKILILLFIISIIISIILMTNLDLMDRYMNLFNLKTFNSLTTLFDSIDFTINRDYYFKTTYGKGLSYILSLDGDGSALIRFYRWIILIGMTLSTYLSATIGLGPSFASSAVDGNYVRLFIEIGTIGMLLFLYIIYLIYKHTKNDFVMRSYILTLIITALFIDIYTTYKAMVLLWFYYGWILRKRKEKK